MTTPKITGNESYYPAVWDSAHNGTIQSDGGITIKQKFIADFMRELASNQFSSAHPTNWGPITKAAEEAFQEYLKVINGE